MADAPPRLDPTAGNQADYAPISWTAVASLGVALVSVVVYAVVAVVAFTRKQPLIEAELLALPVIAVVLAFVARRQIANAEGTRTGEQYANAGWWIAAVCGLGYAAYLLALEQTIRNDAEREFRSFAALVSEIDGANPQDPKLYEAALKTIAPGLRGQVRGPKDVASIDRTFRDEMARFRQLDVLRIVGRNTGRATFANFGVRDWQQQPTKITCTLTCKLTTPEGEHSLVVPMQANVERGLRQWEIVPSISGFVQNRSLTRYGWMVEQLEESGKYFLGYFVQALAIPGRQVVAYDGYVRPGGSPEEGTRQITLSALMPTLVGGAGSYVPPPPGYFAALEGPLLSGPNGAPLSPADRAAFRFCWENNRITPALADGNPDANAVLRLSADGAEMRHPIQLAVPSGGGNARGRVLIATQDPQLLKELDTARSNPGPTLREPPADLPAPTTPWRVVRLESDLRPIPVRPPGGPGE